LKIYLISLNGFKGLNPLGFRDLFFWGRLQNSHFIAQKLFPLFNPKSGERTNVPSGHQVSTPLVKPQI
jgi:hypothetical protein